MKCEPIARNRSVAPLLQAASDPHPALVFERHPGLLSSDGRRFTMQESARLNWLTEFVELARETPGRAQRLAAVHARFDALARSGLRRQARTEWRLAIGLGNPSATEVGMTFDAACGVPCLPGSSLKGLARAWAKVTEAAAPQIAELLGEPGDTGSAGTVVFLDALPLHWPTLDIDIVTRHHDAENLSSDMVLPLDSDKPNPVHFLTVARRQTFVFRLLHRTRGEAEALETAWTWLAAALDQLGAGAKTAAGYGQLVEVPS